MSNSNLEMSIVPILISQINGQKIAIRSPLEHNRGFGHWRPKLGRVVNMVVNSILPHAECGLNDHQKDAFPFSPIILCVFTIWSKKKNFQDGN